ncbi:MAG: ABC transporter ATP-binding protein [Candidatus Omnitrophica bacterium]|nr:ABC transporter ATP-binding protein [Candidatus Omnitrophota bacterium]
MILQIKHLSVSYKGKDGYVEALKNISFDVKEGEILGIIGESGSGKSTIAFSILDLLPQDCSKKGNVIFKGKDIFKLKNEELEELRGRGMSMVFQEPAATFNPVLSIGYQFRELLLCKLPNLNNEEIEKIITDSLSQVHLAQVERVINSYPHQLSTGQLQRISLSFTIALKPALVVADEPTSSLDVTTESQIINLLKELRKTFSFTIVFITHNLDLVKTLCDRALVLYKGEIREIAQVAQLFAFPKDAYTKSLLEAFRELEET